MVKFIHSNTERERVITSLPLIRLVGKIHVTIHDKQVGELQLMTDTYIYPWPYKIGLTGSFWPLVDYSHLKKNQWLQIQLHILLTCDTQIQLL